MNIKKLSDDVSVSPQINIEDCTEILKMGFKSIICNRPDGECETQPSFSSINEQAHELGILLIIYQSLAVLLQKKTSKNSSLPLVSYQNLFLHIAERALVQGFFIQWLVQIVRVNDYDL